MAKRRTRTKGVVYLRQRKLADGGKSLYLDVYANDKRYQKRLGLNLVPIESPLDVESNAKTMQLAETMRAQKQLELQHQNTGIQLDEKLDESFVEYFEELLEKRRASQGNFGNWDSALKHFKKFAGRDVSFRDLNKNLIRDFKDYLMEEARTKSKLPLSQNSQASYFNKFKAAINQAVDDEIIRVHPGKGVKGIKSENPERVYLTEDELSRIAKADCKYFVLKQAFLFSCLTGMRWSDVNKLTWAEIEDLKDKSQIVFRQKKTGGQEYLPMNKQARSLIGKRGDTSERIFDGLKYSSHYNTELLRWAMRAEITKHVTFHSARHTFATILLSRGESIYVVSKLLGHSELKTTQIYGHIIDHKKEEAVEKIPQILLD